MIITNELIRKNMTKYQLSKESGVPRTTIVDICSGKADIEKCSAGTLYKIAKVLGITVEEIIESSSDKYRSDFETFKSNTCHHVKDMGDIEFMIDVLEKDDIRKLYNKRWYAESLYLLAMIDYLSRVNDVPICDKYDDIRRQKLSSPIYANGVVLRSEILQSEQPLRDAEAEAIPEFMRFNIVESEVRIVV